MNSKRSTVAAAVLAVVVLTVTLPAVYQRLHSQTSSRGRPMAYVVAKDVRVLDSNSRGERQATKVGDVMLVFDQRPDGSVLYGRERDPGRRTDTTFSTALWLLQPDGQARELVKDGVMEAKFFPSGRDVLYGTDDYDLYWLHADGKSEQVATKAARASISPNGQLVAYMKFNPDWQRGQYGDKALGLTVLDLGTRQERRLTDRWEDFDPVWSPDGSSLVFSSSRAAGLASVWMMDADGGNQRQMTNIGQTDFDPERTLTAPNRPPLWTSDGRHLVYESDRQVWTLQMDRRRLRLESSKVLGYGEQVVLIDDRTVGMVAAPNSTTTPRVMKVTLDGNVVP